MDHQKMEELLNEPFDAEDLEWKVQKDGLSNKGPWAMVVPYLTSRAIQARLDSVFGMFGWENIFIDLPCGSGYRCGIKVKVDGQWITKYDAAEKTNWEPVKGGHSNAMKRAAVIFGIGRYLYKFETQFANCKIIQSRFDVGSGIFHDIRKDKKHLAYIEWVKPELPAWARPHVEYDSLISDIQQSEDMIELKTSFTNMYKYIQCFKREDLLDRAIKVKDAMKKKLEGEEISRTQRSEGDFVAWFERRITDTILKAENESTLRVQKDILVEEIRLKSEELDSPKEPIIESLKRYYNDRRTKLQTINQAN